MFIIIAPSVSHAGEGGDEWYAVRLPGKLDASSPFNIGALVLDAPAGRHGFVRVEGGNFRFEDGTAARFWGTNLCFNACFPSHAQAEMLVERIAFFGFNAVRLHHMDFFFQPRGIFEDVCPAFKDPQKKRTGVLSPRQLDRLDYLVYQLKKRGIYIDMNLLVSRHFTEADGVKSARELGKAAKPASMFDPVLIELQKQYARDLLTHYNPYTKRRYCDDPAVALVEICNENSIRRIEDKKMPAYYSDQIEARRREWLGRNPGGSSQDFYDSLEKEYFTRMLSFLRGLGVRVPVTGSQYSSSRAQEGCDFIDTHVYWDHPWFPNKPWNRNDFRIRDDSALEDKGLGMARVFAESGENGKPLTLTEWNHCYPNRYSYESPLLMAAKAKERGWDALFQFAFSEGWDGEAQLNDIQSYFEILANPQQLVLCALGSLIFLRNDGGKATIGNGVIEIDSPILKGAAGFIKDKAVPAGGIRIKALDNGAVFVLSPDRRSPPLLIALKEVRNSGSAWKNGRFEWGSGPVLLQKLRFEADVELTPVLTQMGKNSFIYFLPEGKKQLSE